MGVCCCKESMEQKLDEIIAKYKDTCGALIPVCMKHRSYTVICP